jgi:hypothetical protein
MGYGLAKTMIDLFGGVRFRHMNLSRMGGTQLLLYACADTLETLHLDATEICGEKHSPNDVQVLANDFTGSNSHLDLDLSRNKFLRELKIEASSFISVLRGRAPAATPSSFRALLSTINSPAFNFVIFYECGDFYNDVYTEDTRARLGEEDAWYHRQFEVFREMYKARDFRLVLWAESDVGDDSMRELRRAVAAEKAKGGLPPELSITH